MLHKFLLGFVIASLIFLLVVAFSLCRISGYYSRMEEEEELRRMAGAKKSLWQSPQALFWLSQFCEFSGDTHPVWAIYFSRSPFLRYLIPSLAALMLHAEPFRSGIKGTTFEPKTG